MEPGSFEDNDRLRKEIAKLLKNDLNQKIIIHQLQAMLRAAGVKDQFIPDVE